MGSEWAPVFCEGLVCTAGLNVEIKLRVFKFLRRSVNSVGASDTTSNLVQTTEN